MSAFNGSFHVQDERWSIYIDIEGFSALWEKGNEVLCALGELMRGAFRIGRYCFPNAPERIFSHQIGDGFLIVSDFHEESLDRAVTVAAALMRFVGNTGVFAKAAVAEGQFSDIHSCYPREVIECEDANNRLALGMGLMTLFPVMGTALIRAAAVAKTSPRGPLLTIESSKAERLSNEIPTREIPESNLLSIDWLHMDTILLSRIEASAQLEPTSIPVREEKLSRYCTEHTLPRDWNINVGRYLAVPTTQRA